MYWLLVFEEEAIFWVNLIVTAFVVLFIALLIGRIVGKLLQVGLKLVGADRLSRQVFVGFSVSDFFPRLVDYSVRIIGLVLALNTLGLTRYVVGLLLFLIGLWIIISALLWLYTGIPNLFARFQLYVNNRSVSVGDSVALKSVGISGRVVGKRLLYILLKSEEQLFEIPYVVLKTNPKLF